MRLWFRHEQQSIRMAHHSYDRVHTEYGAPRSQNTATRARGGGESHEMKYTAKFRKTPPPQAFFRLHDEEDAEKGRGQGQSWTLGRRSGFSGTPWSTPSTSTPLCRFFILLCRGWWGSCWRYAGTSTPPCPSRLSTCPRYHQTESSSVWLTEICVFRRWRNSWRK